VSILLGKGDGTLHAHQDYWAGNGAGILAAGDFNGDSYVDLAIPDLGWADRFDTKTTLLMGNGDGTFQSHALYETSVTPGALAVTDFNEDGKMDLVVGWDPTATDTSNARVDVLLSNANGSYGPYTAYPTGNLPASVAVGDFNKDGHKDIAVANYGTVTTPDNTVSVLLGNGDGTFAAPKFYPTGLRPSWITAQDLNGDGLPEIVTDNYSDGSVSLFANNGDGTFAPQQQIYPDYGSDNTVVMPVNRSTSPAVVSVDLQVSSVVVTATPALKGKPVKNQPKPGVYRVSGAKVSSDAGHGGTFDGMSLLLLGVFLARRRLFRAA
jgi:hypothetical protein